MHCLFPGLLSVQGIGVAGDCQCGISRSVVAGRIGGGRGEGGHDVQEIKEIKSEGPCGGRGPRVPSGGQGRCEPGSAHAGVRWRRARRARA